MEFLIGLTSSWISISTIYPIDVLKTRYQVNASHAIKKTPLQILQEVKTNYGYRGFYRGLVPQLCTYPLFWATYFEAKSHINFKPSDVDFVNKALESYGAAAVASTVANPLFVTKVKMQTLQTKSVFKTVSTMYQQNGWKFPFKGISACYINNLKLGLQFPLYDKLHETNGIIVSTIVSKLTVSTIFYPSDLIRANQRSSDKMLGLVDAGKQIIKNYGIRGLYRGVLLYNLVSMSDFIIMMTIREKLRNYTNKID